MQYEIKNLAVMRNNNADEFSREHCSNAEKREMSGKPILTVEKNYICTKNIICTKKKFEFLKSLEEVTTGKPPD